MWETPIYKFRIPNDENSSEPSELKEIVIDVTGSAPPFKEPSESFKEVIREIFKSDSIGKIDTVLEFGAAKLKNIPFLLEQGKTVSTVEFEELSENIITKKNIERCREYGSKFKELVFPNPFLIDDKKFDLALLPNVSPVMPIFAERLYLLNLLYERVNDDKYLLWIAQKEGSYKKIREDGENTCGDGIWMGKNKRYKTFFKYHKIEELDEFMSLFGFQFIKKFSVSDDARLYKKTSHNLFSDVISSEKIEQYFPQDVDIEDPKDTEIKIFENNETLKLRIPNPKSLSIESLYIEKIRKIPVGTEPEIYHRVVSHAVARIFRGSLRNMDIKVETADGRKIIDTVFTNYAENGFFNNLKSKFECAYPIVEVKNISTDPSNPDFDQLNGRLNKNKGHFGILICRKIDNEKFAKQICKGFLPDSGILTLTDNDICELLEYSREGDSDEINDIMDKKLKDLLF